MSRELEVHTMFVRDLGQIEAPPPDEWLPRQAHRGTPTLARALVVGPAVVAIVVATVLAIAVLRSPDGGPPVAASGAPTPSATPTAVNSGTPQGAPTPRGYVLPSECSYVGDPELRGSATVWRVRCPQGLLTTALGPSLRSQGWESCSAAEGSFFYRKAGDPNVVILRNFVNRSDATGELEQHPATQSCGP